MKRPISLRWGLLTTIVVCWVVPIIVVVIVAGILLNGYYEGFLRQTVQTSAESAMRQIELRLNATLEASKAVSYDGDVRGAYKRYLADHDDVALHGAVTEYLSNEFGRDANFKAVFIRFLDDDIGTEPYVISQGIANYHLLQRYRNGIREQAVAVVADRDTGIYFETIDGELCMVRNLMSSSFEPYAVLVMLCDASVLFQSLEAITNISDAQISIDGTVIDLSETGAMQPTRTPVPDTATMMEMEYHSSASGHTLSLSAEIMGLNLWGALPGLRWAIALILLLGLPIIAVIIGLFYRHVTRPVETLVAAANHMQAGHRGYQISERPRSLEFQKLYSHFNSMSTELKAQFDRIYLEQQALQQAKIKALQSQINPHFLNNTLEIINWEARLANNERVSAMIDALSTMLNAAMDRDGRAVIALREELGYVDAYLYIIKERLGERLDIVKQIDEQLLDIPIPRLILQPLVENAVEHDISGQHRGKLVLRVYHEAERLFLEVEHNGVISERDGENIRQLLSGPPQHSEQVQKTGSVGLRNVNQRLRLLYGENSTLSIEQIGPEQILARIAMPLNGQMHKQ